MNITWPRLSRGQTALIAVALLAAIPAFSGLWIYYQFIREPDAQQPAPEDHSTADTAQPQADKSAATIDFPRESWPAAGIEIQPAERKGLAQSVALTGKIALNEDRLAHVFPLVEGRVNEVKVQFGDKVTKGDLLVVVQSKEVGQAKLQLFQDRQQREYALTKDRWTQAVSANAQAMIKLIREGSPLEEIEKQLAQRPLGDYRDKLMTAYINHYKSQKQFERLQPLSQEGSVPARRLLEAEADWNAARATMQSLVEQIQQDAQQAATVSAQSVKELETRVAVDETNLRILGVDDQSLAAIDPARQGAELAHYPIYAPFDGTIISKDVVLLERVGPENQILSIADLSTVWVTADIYEEHLPLLRQLERQPIQVRSSAWPGKTFTAKVFYSGDVVDESSRTISLRAVADNHEGVLKPGMFVNVELPSLTQPDVLQVPLTAIQDHEGKSFVFVHVKDDAFQRRDVTLGRRNAQAVEVETGVQPGEQVVTKGGFALKSRMLAELLAE